VKFTGGSGHGHGAQAVLGAVEVAVHNWAVFYGREGNVSRVCLDKLIRERQNVIVLHNRIGKICP
jgi:hypothetical protein